MFLLRSLFLFICESSLFELITPIFFLNFFFFLISDSGAFDVPSFLLSPFFRSLILNWISTCWGSLFRVFLKEIFIFQAQRGCNGILLMFQDKQTWSYIILNYDCLIFREINSRNRFQRFQVLDIFLFFFFLSSYILLRLPFAGFQSNRLLFLFLLILFFQCL